MLFDAEEDDDFFECADDNDVIAPVKSHFKDPRLASNIISQLDIEKKLFDLLTGDRPPQGLVFTGSMGVGKATMAFRVARFLLQQREDTMGLFGEPEPRPENLFVPESDPVFHLIASGGHPDLLTIERQIDEKSDRRKASLSVEELRKITPFLRKTSSYEQGWRVVIIDDADTMTRSSQNALLKILEEPPPKTLLILITHRLSSLLPTILSRVNVINFPVLSDDDLKAALKLHYPHIGEADLNNVVKISEGSLGRAITYAKPEQLELIALLSNLLQVLPAIEWTKIQALAAQLGTKESEDLLKTFHDFVVNFVQGHVRYAMLNGLDPEPYFACLNSLNDGMAKAQLGNLDKKLVVLGAFDALSKLL